jgi:acyl-CoA hydrolase
MAWHDEYRSKLKTTDEALRCIESGARVYVHANAAFPQALLEGLTRRAPHVRDVEVMHLIAFGDAPYIRPEYAESFRHRALFIGPNVRSAVQQGFADYTPIHLSEIEGLFTSGQLEIDVALIHVAPPDAHGYCSLGVAVETTLTAARCARRVVAQVNDRMPRTCGNSYLHVSEIDAFVEISRQLPEVPPAEATEEQRKIAGHVANLIEDGSCLQTGIGGIPDSVLTFLHDRKDLGIHTELLSDGAITLIESGVITGRRKQINRDKIVCGFVLGTQRLYDFVDENPVFEFQPNGIVNNPLVVAQNNNMVAINSAIEVDITGQVCSDSMGLTFYSGFGGQVDFIRGAARSRGGKPIIALPSTAKKGTISRIKPMLTPGAGVVTSRADVQYVVTEFGVAYLHGKTIRERAEALIQIAHPKFRSELIDHCERANYFRRATVEIEG